MKYNCFCYKCHDDTDHESVTEFKCKCTLCGLERLAPHGLWNES